MGGNDQQVNIIAGMDLTHKVGRDSAAASPSPPFELTGTEFGRSKAVNGIASAERTSIYKFYQFWINVDDDLEKLYKLFTFRELDEIAALLEEHNKEPAPPQSPERTCAGDDMPSSRRSRSKKRAHDASAVLFGEMDIKDAGADLLETLSGEIPSAEISSKAGAPR